MMIAWAASRNRCTLRSARSFAALVERSTARCFQAGSSPSMLTAESILCAMLRTLLQDYGRSRRCDRVSLNNLKDSHYHSPQHPFSRGVMLKHRAGKWVTVERAAGLNLPFAVAPRPRG